MSRSRLVTYLCVVLLILGSTTVSRGADSPAPATLGQRIGSPGEVVLRADDRVSSLHILRRERPAGLHTLRVQAATFTVRYLANESSGGYSCGTWDPAAKAAFQYAVDIWAEQVYSPPAVPIVIEACWTDLSHLGNVLGSAGPAQVRRGFAGAPRADTWYPIALANAFAEADLNGAGPEINVRLNSGFPGWYLGTDGSPGGAQHDFVTVAVHEICHGLGFIGSMWVDGTGRGSWGGQGWGWAPPYLPFAFDHHLENGNGQPLLISFANPSVALGNQLTGLGNGVYFNGSEANAANGGVPVKLYAPASWDGGSSIYHVDEIYDGTPNALMTYSISRREVNHGPGPITRGILADLGWRIAAGPDLAISKRVAGPYAPAPGQAVTYTLSIENTGSDTATQVVVTDVLPVEVLTTTWSSSPSLAGLSLRGGTRYVWDLPSLAAGASGTITIVGTISPSLPIDYALWNTASVACDEQESAANNTSSALAGGQRVYLPLAVKGD